MHFSSGIMLPIDSSSRDFGIQFLTMLEELCPELMPKRCGNWEPLECDCSSLATEEIIERYWQDMFIWECRRKKTEANCDVSRHYVHFDPCFSGFPDFEVIDRLTTLFERICGQFDVDFGWFHLLGKSELDTVTVNTAEYLWNPINSGITSNCLMNQGIPNLTWLTIFGEPYLQYVNEEHFQDCERVWRAGEDTTSPLFVQLTNNPFDPIEKYEEFDALRMKIKAGIPADIFCSSKGNATVRPEFTRRDGSKLPM